MYFKITCSHCGKSLKVRQDTVGRRGRCPYCHNGFIVPATATDVPIATPRRSPRAVADAPRPRAALAGAGSSSGTNVPMLTSALIALALSLIFYLVAVVPMHRLYLGDLFLRRGWVPYVLAFLMAWAVAILFLKWRKLARQKESMLFDLLPNELADDITPGTLDRFIEHVRSLPIEPGRSFLISRVLRALEHFRVRRSNPEVAAMLGSQSEIDATAVDSSYAIVKVFIWAIPILGFIGTVMGIGAAVGGFSGALDKAQDIDVLKTSLNQVTAGLAVAFDTTLIALVMSLLVSFPASSLQKAEEDLLIAVDEYCNENLLKRLNDGDRGVGASGDLNDAVRQAIDAAMAGRQGAMLQQLHVVQEQLAQLQREQVQQLHAAMRGLTERTDNAQHQVADTMRAAAESLRGYFSGLEQGLDALNSVLKRLGEQQVVIQAPPAPRPRWRLFGRGNGGASDE